MTPACHIRTALRSLGRWLSNLGEPPRPAVLTNRNQLLRVDARTESDSCDAFVQGKPGAGDCWSDGHYLCLECSRMSQDSMVERREWAPGEMKDV